MYTLIKEKRKWTTVGGGETNKKVIGMCLFFLFFYKIEIL